MPNKSIELLSETDRLLRRLYPVGMIDNTVVIKKKSGFELFNTRPYHNYETFSDGYYICDGQYYIESEDLDDALRLLENIKTNKIEAKNYQIASESILKEFGFIK